MINTRIDIKYSIFLIKIKYLPHHNRNYHIVLLKSFYVRNLIKNEQEFAYTKFN